VARQALPGADRMRHVFAYHEIVRSIRAVPSAAKNTVVTPKNPT
jgi:hypothetical protein